MNIYRTNFVFNNMDVIEILSDADDTIIVSSNEPLDNDSDIENIVNKYISKNNSSTDQISDDLTYIPLMKKLKQSTTKHINDGLSSGSSSQDEDNSDHTDDHNILQLLSEKYKPSVRNNLDEILLDEKLNVNEPKPVNAKEKKREERERKKLEKEREKCLKKALMQANKNIKPGECMKFICVNLDNEIINQDYGNEIISSLQAADVKYNIQSQIFSNTISWTRKNLSCLIGDNAQLSQSSDQDTDEILLIIACKNFLEHVQNNNLFTHIQSLKSVLTGKKITLIIYGLKNYFRYKNNQKQNELRSQVSRESQSQKQSKDLKIFQNYPQVSKKNIESALTELQILCNCSHRVVNSPTELGLVVAQFTKSIAELPFKLQRREKYQQTDWFAAGDNRDCVKVDPAGNGLQRLYKQMLITFPLASLETAEAICSIHPTVTSLMKAYENCESTQEAETLLKDIPIRRAAGPFSAARKIGPELSRKVFHFFTAVEGGEFL